MATMRVKIAQTIFYLLISSAMKLISFHITTVFKMLNICDEQVKSAHFLMKNSEKRRK